MIEIVCVSIYFKRNYKNLGKEKSKNRCGYIYEQLKYDRPGGGYSLSYSMLYQLRFLILTFVVLFMHEFSIIT